MDISENSLRVRGEEGRDRGDTVHWMGKEDIPATQTPAPPTYIGFPYFVAAAFFFLSQDEEKGPF